MGNHCSRLFKKRSSDKQRDTSCLSVAEAQSRLVDYVANPPGNSGVPPSSSLKQLRKEGGVVADNPCLPATEEQSPSVDYVTKNRPYSGGVSLAISPSHLDITPTGIESNIRGDVSLSTDGVNQGKIANPPELSAIPMEISRVECQVEYKKITRIVPKTPFFFRDFPLAEVFDFQRLARELHDAFRMESETNEVPKRIFCVLRSLQYEPEAIEGLEKAYKKQYKTEKDLVQLLEKHLNRNRLDYALQLINKGKNRNEHDITQIFISDDERYDMHQKEQDYLRKINAHLQKVAMHIHSALQVQENFAPEPIFAALTPLQRNTELLVRLNDTYRQQFSTEQNPTDLCIALKKLEGNSLDYARYLLGDQELEVPAVSRIEAESLYQAISELTFPVDKVGKRAQVPYRALGGSCSIRAYVISQVFKEIGYSSRKVAASSFDRPFQSTNLELSTYYGDDRSIQEPLVEEYSVHIAPYIYYYDDNISLNNYKEFVIDPIIYNPSMHVESSTIGKWAEKISRSSFEYIDSPEAFADIKKNGTKDDTAYIFTAKRDILYSAPWELKYAENLFITEEKNFPDQSSYDRYEKRGKDVLKRDTEIEPHYYIAATIRRHYQHCVKYGLDINQIDGLCNYIKKFDPNVRAKFPTSTRSNILFTGSYFPQLYNSFTALLSSEASKKVKDLFFPA